MPLYSALLSPGKTFDTNDAVKIAWDHQRRLWAHYQFVAIGSFLPLLESCVALQGKEKVEGVGTGALAAAMAYSNFDVSQLATWRAGEPVPFSFLAKTFDAIANTTKRLEIIKTLVGAFRAILATTPEDLLPIVYLCTNQVRFGYRMTVTCNQCM